MTDETDIRTQYWCDKLGFPVHPKTPEPIPAPVPHLLTVAEQYFLDKRQNTVEGC